MNILLDENKKQKAIKFISLNSRNWSYIFELFKDEIFEMIELKVPKTDIVRYLSSELNANIKYTTFDSWLKKRKKQNSNTLIKNTKKQKNEIKKEEIKKIKENNENIKNKDEEIDDEDWKSVIFPQIEEACEGMKKANLKI